MSLLNRLNKNHFGILHHFNKRIIYKKNSRFFLEVLENRKM